jgi:uncharacterized damage-inducible protein DinB
MKLRAVLIAWCVLGCATSAAAQAGGAGETSASLRKNFEAVSGWLIKAAEQVPADKYTYQPAKTVRTFGQQIGHVVDGYNYFCAAASGKKVPWSEATEKGSTDKATLVQKLKQSTASCTAVYAGTGPAHELINNIAHANLHYGNVITYMRMLGLVPPSS